MKNFFKTATLLLVATFVLQSCTSNETDEDIVSDEQIITTDLADKIITTATSLNDYNFFVSNASKTNCGLLSITSGYFNTPEGDHFPFTFSNTESLEMWLTQYNDAKLQAFNATGVEFSDEDFFITYISRPTGFSGLEKRESMLDYFENCDYGFGDTPDYGLPFTDISSNCDSNAEIHYWITGDDGTFEASFETSSLNSAEDTLDSYNLQNNTNYTLENVKVGSLKYITPNQETLRLSTIKELTNYFENCMLSRDASEDDCLNFVYPLQVNRTNQQMNEIITLENDDDLATTFGTNPSELAFVFPINLLGANGTAITIDTNEALETALDSAATYSN